MKKVEKLHKTLFVIAVFSTLISIASTAYSEAIIIDHTCTDLSQIPDTWIDSVQANQKLHYAHTSHGSQLTTGLQRIENADNKYSQARGLSYLPNEEGAFCIFDGQEYDTYITPEEYWDSEAGKEDTQDVIDHNLTINASMWSWCCQLTSYTEAHLQIYLDIIDAFEAANPDVTFIYMTCNAQATGSSGYNRYLRNEQIRNWVLNSGSRVLFDFADLDSWWYNPDTEQWGQATYEYDGHTVPKEHPQFNGNEAGHTTYESCEQKGKAVWWMMARIAGWPGPSTSIPTLSEWGVIIFMTLMMGIGVVILYRCRIV